MSNTLYRKYRPKSFEELTGQNHIKLTLQNQVEGGKIAQAYLFTGPRGVGKTTTARLLAAAVNCATPDDCTPIYEGKDMDVLEIDAASHSGVDNVRENIIENSRFTPQKRKYKVFIIDEVHMLSVSAFNALLKILEEPPTHVLFILATTELHKVPATIVSRCQRFDFRKISQDDIKARLKLIVDKEGRKVEEEVLDAIAAQSDGSLRDSETMLGQILSIGERKITIDQASLFLPRSNVLAALEFVTLLLERQAEGTIILINRLTDEGVSLLDFTSESLEIMRRCLIYKVSSSLLVIGREFGREVEKNISQLCAKASLKELTTMIEIFSKRRQEIKSCAIPQLPSELGIVEFCETGRAVENFVPVRLEAKKEEKIIPTAEVKKKPARLDASPIELSVIKSKWADFLGKVSEVNPSLVLILKTAEPLNCQAGQVTLGYKYSFHKLRMDDQKILASLEKIFGEFYGGNFVIFNSVLPSNYQSEFIKDQVKDDEVELVAAAPGDDLLKSLISTFGGKIVE